jgi:hypothetical protein
VVQVRRWWRAPYTGGVSVRQGLSTDEHAIVAPALCVVPSAKPSVALNRKPPRGQREGSGSPPGR